MLLLCARACKPFLALSPSVGLTRVTAPNAAPFRKHALTSQAKVLGDTTLSHSDKPILAVLKSSATEEQLAGRYVEVFEIKAVRKVLKDARALSSSN